MKKKYVFEFWYTGYQDQEMTMTLELESDSITGAFQKGIKTAYDKHRIFGGDIKRVNLTSLE